MVVLFFIRFECGRGSPDPAGSKVAGPPGSAGTKGPLVYLVYQWYGESARRRPKGQLGAAGQIVRQLGLSELLRILGKHDPPGDPGIPGTEDRPGLSGEQSILGERGPSEVCDRCPVPSAAPRY
ncbi:unnamed protein product [Onchocerca ochengi]|uniref:Death domain-containing protein n=1 Tax=Onchocerca ochengi TaxID=42157 RepID=A0A182E9G7_ONCOC|nr:unnamed protein product [Onchocerca ochengi]